MNYSSRQQPKRNWLRKVDWILVLVISLLALTSVILISSAMGGGQYSANFSIRQIIYYIFGAIIAFLIMIICVLLIGLLILPETSITPIINGAKSWYSFGPISIQPSEFMKIILILALAKTISKHNQFTFNKSFQSDLMLFFKILGVSIIPMALILLQNDLGTTLVLCAIIAGVMLVSGITW
ncbi:rod shape-determining protein RodA, partial [Ralstonia insidiosa]|nr:rod shape-determining protein RodA [Ralstonia insidiosa]